MGLKQDIDLPVQKLAKFLEMNRRELILDYTCVIVEADEVRALLQEISEIHSAIPFCGSVRLGGRLLFVI
ncbi:hypothetical protein [Sphingomonas sp. dw_22]|uniref:hypothetical protein n=1 Tax=Sphingomonas sp. dw_22 TaxID=2721175 RepID=UPI001BD2B0BC|nr:hypothetical protein [Sphingomonas sp. dw_22]